MTIYEAWVQQHFKQQYKELFNNQMQEEISGLLQERDNAIDKGKALCVHYGNALMQNQELKEEVDRLSRELMESQHTVEVLKDVLKNRKR